MVESNDHFKGFILNYWHSFKNNSTWIKNKNYWNNKKKEIALIS